MCGRGIASIGLAVVAATVTVLVAVSGAPRAGADTMASGQPSAGVQSATSTGVSTLGLGGWQVESSAVAGRGGGVISEADYPAEHWLHVTPDDAGAPGTEIEALLQSGACPNVFYSTNMRKCFGYEPASAGHVFPSSPCRGGSEPTSRSRGRVVPRSSLIVHGVVGAGRRLWSDGTRWPAAPRSPGDDTRFTFDVTQPRRPAENGVALEVYPNNPQRMFTLDDVDWNQMPPDNNTGIQFPVQLDVHDAVRVGNDYVTRGCPRSDNGRSHRACRPDQCAELGTPSQRVTATVTGAAGGGQSSRRSSQMVTVPSGQTQQPSRSLRAANPALTLHNPAVWWPYQMGCQPLYQLSVPASADGAVARSPVDTFGIRTVTTFLTSPSALAPHGVRRFAINGLPFLVRGGGWAENLFLHYSASDVADPDRSHQEPGTERDPHRGQGDAGQLLRPDGPGRHHDRRRLPVLRPVAAPTRRPRGDPSGLRASWLNSAYAIGQTLRNHPSVIDYSWSDNAPTRRSRRRVRWPRFARAGFDDPDHLLGRVQRPVRQLGPSGEKEGPYDWVPARPIGMTPATSMPAPPTWTRP